MGLQRRTNRIRYTSLVLVLPTLLSGCATWTSESTVEPTGDQPLPRAQVWQHDTMHDLRNVRITADSVTGTSAVAGVPLAQGFAREDIDSLRVRRQQPGRTNFAVLLGVLAVAAAGLLHLASNIST